jgi:hypothetical protein
MKRALESIFGLPPSPRVRPVLDELDDFLCGQADEETRQRVAGQLFDPTSGLRRFVDGARQRAEAITGWEGTRDDIGKAR